MANTQIGITENGTTTLATAGKYCETNVDVNVNVPVPSGYIKPAGSKTITENGTHDVTQYASAVVNVAGKPTQFTNLYDPANVVLKTTSSASSSLGGWETSADNSCNYTIIPYHHAANTPFVLRMRGIGTVRDRMAFCALKEDKQTAVYYGQMPKHFTTSYDEYGDACVTLSKNLDKVWDYFVLNFQYNGINSGVTEAKEGPIITINEPIGNGGYAA